MAGDDRLGDEAWVRLLNTHNRLVRRQVERAGGYEVKAQGDGFMLAFPSARSATLCSIDIMRAIEEDGELFGKPEMLAVRIANRAWFASRWWH